MKFWRTSGQDGLSWGVLLAVLTVALAFPAFAAAQSGPANRGPVPGRGQAPGQGGPGQGPQPPSRNPLQPPWIPLPAAHAEYVDKILSYWDHRSSGVKRFRCTFKKWEYDPIFGPKGTFVRFASGQIKYSAPDKALFKEDQLLHYQAPKEATDQPKYVPLPHAPGAHWICDGKWIFEMDAKKEQMIARQLPPNVSPRAIASGPLPFLFGAKKEEIKERYWIRVVTPEQAKGEYWLEAFPKSRDDAASFKMIHIILDEKDYLPKAMVIFDRAYDPTRNPARTTFQLDRREVNWSVLPEQLNIFHRNFYEPRLPKGWQKVEEKLPSGALPGQAQRPASPPATGPRAAARGPFGPQRR